MNCRLGCGACCIASSITRAIPGMPNGKPAGIRCIQLSEDNLCKIFGHSDRPSLCDDFKATEDVCGQSNTEALQLITWLESQTSS